MTIEDRLGKFLSCDADVARAAFVAPCAQVMGAVTLGRDASVFYGAVLRGDIEAITVGESSNIQDGAVIHVADDLPAAVGDFCTVGHGAIIHACTIGDCTLIGMRATVLDGARVAGECLVAAGAVVLSGAEIPPGSLVAGVPAKVLRSLSAGERTGLKHWAEKYVPVARAHALRARAARSTQRHK